MFVTFFVSLYLFIIAEWIMHSKFAFHYFSWISLDKLDGIFNCLILFLFFETVGVAIMTFLSKAPKLRQVLLILANFWFAKKLLDTVGFVSYCTYKYAPYYSAFWVFCTIQCNIFAACLSNIAVFGYYLTMK